MTELHTALRLLDRSTLIEGLAMAELHGALRVLGASALLRRVALPAALAAMLSAGCGGASDAPAPPTDGGVELGEDAQIATGRDGGAELADAGPTVLDVAGQVVDPDGAPLADRIVRVDGRTATTDAEGRFAFDDVPVPYDVLVTRVGSTQVRIAAGLRTASPVVADGWRTSRSSELSGTVTGLPAPAAGSAEDLYGVTSDYGGETSDGWASNSFSNRLARWEGPATATHRLLVLRATFGDDRMPVAYHGLGTATFEVTSGTPVSGIAVTAVDPGETMLHTSAAWPADAVGHAIGVHVAAAGANVLLATEVDGDDVDVVMPSGAGITAGLTATAWTPGGIGMRFVQGLPTNASDVALDVPAPPRVVSPEPGATGVAPGDAISWTWEEEGFYVVQIGVSDGASGWATFVEIRTTETSVVIPDLGGLGIEWPADRSMSVWIYAIGLERSPEEVPAFDLWELVGRVWGSDSMTREDGTLGFIRDGVQLTTGG